MTEIFVFGSNLAGRHGKGSAKKAVKKYNARYGVGQGRTGDSYAIPTKDKNLKILPLDIIQHYINDFIKYAKDNQNLTFKIVKLGCGLSGYTDEQIAHLFKDAPNNCKLPDIWRYYNIIIF